MVIGGLQKLSLLDYPGCLSAIVFTKGCNFRCPFCYNPMFVLPAQARVIEQGGPSLTEEDLFAFLETRKGKLDGVVITGGEPTLHQDLPDMIAKIRDLGFLVKLDTNGTNPEMLNQLLEADLLDYVAMDIKAPWQKYPEIVGVKVDCEKIQKSANIIMNSGLEYEFRTTVPGSLLTAGDVLEMAHILKGAKRWYLQGFISSANLLEPSLKGSKTYTEIEMNKIAAQAGEIAGFCQVRGY